MAERQKILIVDDDASIAELIALYLNKESACHMLLQFYHQKLKI